VRATRPDRALARTAILAVCAAGAIVGCGGDDDRPPVTVTTGNPAVTFAPLVHLHAEERSLPLDARTFIENSALRWAGVDSTDEMLLNGPGRVGRDPERVPLLRPGRLGIARPYAHTVDRAGGAVTYRASQHTRPYDPGRLPALQDREGFYLDLLTEWRSGGPGAAVERVGSQATLSQVPAYFETGAERVDGRPGLRLTYWLLYGENDPPVSLPANPLSHEGDWERVSVLLRRGGRPDSYTPIAVRYHDGPRPQDVAWSDAPVASRRSGGPRTHPVAFATRGGHTPVPAPLDRRQPARADGLELAVHEQATACPACPEWRTWRKLLPARTQPWWGYGGAWGSPYRSNANSGPLGPFSRRGTSAGS